jgi:hypothetical protein
VLPYLGVAPEREPAAAWPGEPEPGEESAPEANPTRYAAAEPASVAPGTLPDLTGMPARLAVATTAALGLSPRVHGEGVVFRQSPEPGASISAAGPIVDLWLGARGAERSAG